MSAADVWAGLEAGDWGPHGPPLKFRARCPAHGGENPTALSVTETPDGHVLVHCHVYGPYTCSVQEIMDAIGVPMSALFPPDHDYGRRLGTPRRQDFSSGSGKVAASVLVALERLGLRADFSVTLDRCPHCGSPEPQLVLPRGGEMVLHCWNDCAAETFLGALAERLHERRLG